MNLKNICRILDAGKAGQSAGSMELEKTPVEEARKWVAEQFEEHGFTIDEEIPDFDSNYKKAQNALPDKEVLRKDMPRIDPEDINGFKRALEKGYLGIVEPFDETFEDNPFPRGLDPDSDLAKEWLESGLQKHDNATDPKDDAVACKIDYVAVGKLLPIQSQIYVDKAMSHTCADGAEKTIEFLMSPKNCFVISKDNRIIDGHHRWLSGILIDPEMEVQCLKIDLPIDMLLKVACTYGDAIGNTPNL